MRRRGAWRIGMAGSNLFFILPRLDCPLRRRRRTSGQAATTNGRSEAASRRGRDRPTVLAALGRSGCFDRPGLPASCGAGRARRRPWASLLRPPNGTNQIGPPPQRENYSSFAVRGLLRAARHASIVRSTARSDSCLSIHLGRGGVNNSLRRAAKSFKRNWVAPHPSQKRRKHKNGVAAPGWRPSSAAAHCPCSSDAARRRGDRGLSLEPHC